MHRPQRRPSGGDQRFSMPVLKVILMMRSQLLCKNALVHFLSHPILFSSSTAISLSHWRHVMPCRQFTQITSKLKRAV